MCTPVVIRLNDLLTDAEHFPVFKQRHHQARQERRQEEAAEAAAKERALRFSHPALAAMAQRTSELTNLGVQLDAQRHRLEQLEGWTFEAEPQRLAPGLRQFGVGP